MRKKTLLFVCTMLMGSMLINSSTTQAKSSKKEKAKMAAAAAKDSTKKGENAYAKLFKGKQCETKKGLLTIHKVDETKLYFELPVSIFGREMLLGSTVSEISNNAHGVIGYKAKDPLHVTFRKMGENINLCLVNNIYGADMDAPDNEGIANAVKKSTIDGIYRTFKLEAYNADSSAVVIDVTPLFMEDNKDLTPFDPYSVYGYGNFSRTTTFEKSKSHLSDIKAFEDNITIKSYLSYSTDVLYKSTGMMGAVESKRAFTALMTRSMILLPQTEMRPRIADSRMNIFVAPKAKFSANLNRGTMPVYYARHWRVEPSDVEKYNRGELVEPIKHIDFYVDKNFPEAWKPSIKAGIEQWNVAFEQIGFKNVVRALDYPQDDPQFDPDNIKYSCVRYAPISIMNAMGPSWDDPRTGEIINASVMVYHDITRLINNWRFLHTAAADPQVRTMNIPQEVMNDALRYVIAHEIGHCLGYMHNMASSAAIPTDSLRSPSFTQKHGTTMSIMDYARFNHVAQPGDGERGVRMTPPNMGVYDFFAVKWLYSPISDAKTATLEVPTLNKWISDCAGDPVFRYGKQQPYNTLDPSAQAEDLGDDLVKSAQYGINNLKYILKHINEWVDKDDQDYEYRESIYPALLSQYLRFVVQVYNVKGGVYMNERKAGDPRPSWSFVDADYQRRAQKFLGDQLHDIDWLDNNDLVKSLSLKGNLSVKMQKIILNLLIADRGSLGRLHDPNPNAYSVQENSDDARNRVFEKTIKGLPLTPRDRTNQVSYIEQMFMFSGLTKGQSNDKSIAATDDKDQFAVSIAPGFKHADHTTSQCFYNEATSNHELFDYLISDDTEDVNGFGYFRSLVESFTPRDAVYYNAVVESRKLIRKMKNTGSKYDKAHYEMLLHRLDGVLE